MWVLRFSALFLLFPVILWAQEEDDDEDGESEIEFGEAADDEEGDYRSIVIEPYPPPVPPEQAEPNRPTPVVVGEWRRPPITKPQTARHKDLLARRAAEPKSADVRYALAEFYLQVQWLPQAEAEFLACADLEPTSIRPWEGLLRVYAAELPETGPEPEVIEQGPLGLVIPIGLGNRRPARQERPDWIPSASERFDRIARALAEVVQRRPDDVTRRRELLEHMAKQGRYDVVETQARAILKLVPGDARTRFVLVQSILYRHREESDEARAAGMLKEARALLEENLRRAPEHVPTSLRLVRVLAVQEGGDAGERIADLQKRAFLRMFLVEGLGTVPYREDTFRMARDLSGKALANRFWNERIGRPERNRARNPWVDDDPEERVHVTRWIPPFAFPNSTARDRERVVRTLARRGDTAAAVLILSYLWHLQDYALFTAESSANRAELQRAEDGAVKALAGLGAAAVPAAQRYLRMAETPSHRRRAVRVLRAIGDKRAAPSLIDALAWDVDEDRAYHVAAALEELGEPRAIDALVAAALDGERPPERRTEAAEALAVFRDPRAIEAINALRKEDGFRVVSDYAMLRLTGDQAALERLVALIGREGGSPEILRLARKANAKALLVAIFEKSSDPELREQAMATLKERFGKEAHDDLVRMILKEAQTTAPSQFVLRELGEIGGPAAATRLLELVNDKRVPGELWAAAARALARTGDERAVRWFSRAKVLEKDPGRRKLAAKLYLEAAKRRAELKRQQ
ncbi:MAG: HEAT repeat domain-containing protein [Planctomycetota bacterium]